MLSLSIGGAMDKHLVWHLDASNLTFSVLISRTNLIYYLFSDSLPASVNSK